MTIVRREVSDRTPLGKVFKYLFIAFNIIMFMLLLMTCSAMPEAYRNATEGAEYVEAAQAGAALGAAAVFSSVLMLWVMGDIILGTIVLLTRRKKIIETEVDS